MEVIKVEPLRQGLTWELTAAAAAATIAASCGSLRGWPVFSGIRYHETSRRPRSHWRAPVRQSYQALSRADSRGPRFPQPTDGLSICETEMFTEDT